MFTGLVQAVGVVERREPTGDAIGFVVRAPGWAERLRAGESIAVDGVCHTVTVADGSSFRFQSVRTTLARTTLGEFEAGRRVNLERALRAGDPLGGHFVQGHVDGVGVVRAVEPLESMVRLRLELPEQVEAVTVPRGALAVDGVSLTVAELVGGVAEVAIIPYTWSRTALSRLEAGATVNLESDLIAKLVHKLVEAALAARVDRAPGPGMAESGDGGD